MDGRVGHKDCSKRMGLCLHMRDVMKIIKKKSGLTIVEMVVAALIFMIFSAGFYATYIMSMRSQKMADNYYRAILIARNRVQLARAWDFYSLPGLAESNVIIDANGDPPSAGQGGLYRRTTLVSTNSGSTNLTIITVQVNYPLPKGGLSTQPVEVATEISYTM
jgi:type II secretory pathway pseudopilin PulG